MKILIVGVGNEIMGDDGIGPAVINELERLDQLPSCVDLLDEGAGGMRIIHDIEGYDKVLIIDAADFGGEPGEHRMFRPEEVSTKKELSGRSLHEMDLIKTIELARLMGTAPGEIWIMAVQPKVVSLGKPLSTELRERMDDYILAVEQKASSLFGKST